MPEAAAAAAAPRIARRAWALRLRRARSHPECIAPGGPIGREPLSWISRRGGQSDRAGDRIPTGSSAAGSRLHDRFRYRPGGGGWSSRLERSPVLNTTLRARRKVSPCITSPPPRLSYCSRASTRPRGTSRASRFPPAGGGAPGTLLCKIGQAGLREGAPGTLQRGADLARLARLHASRRPEGVDQLQRRHPLRSGQRAAELPAAAVRAELDAAGFTCASRVTGVTCNTRGGHGLFISRESWRAW